MTLGNGHQVTTENGISTITIQEYDRPKGFIRRLLWKDKGKVREQIYLTTGVVEKLDGQRVWMKIEGFRLHQVGPLLSMLLDALLSDHKAKIQEKKKRLESHGLELVRLERIEHKEVHGWINRHDDNYRKSELINAAICYARAAIALARGDAFQFVEKLDESGPDTWPFPKGSWKPREDDEKNLVKAASLIVAEIDRRHRLKQKLLESEADQQG